MSARKTIQINPDFFKMSGKGKTKKKRDTKEKRHDLRLSIKPNDIKKKLMAKIKEHQKQNLQNEKTIQKTKEKEEKAEQEFTQDFNKQIDYLEKIINGKKEKDRKKKRRRRTRRHEGNPISAKKSNIAPAPPYGCLKNGIKPTYSQYKKTLKVREKIQISDPPKEDEDVPIKPQLVNPPTRVDRLAKLKERLATPKKPAPIKKLVSVKKTIKIYKLGKNEKKANVGVLVKSGKTRKLVKKEQEVLRKKCLSEIKEYLRKHNLIKIGSSAPEAVLRQIYENSFLAGNIYNKNPDNLLHNYLNNEDDANGDFN
jgi:hypothetical protein